MGNFIHAGFAGTKLCTIGAAEKKGEKLTLRSRLVIALVL